MENKLVFLTGPAVRGRRGQGRRMVCGYLAHQGLNQDHLGSLRIEASFRGLPQCSLAGAFRGWSQPADQCLMGALHSLQNPTYLLPGPLQKTFADCYARVLKILQRAFIFEYLLSVHLLLCLEFYFSPFLEQLGGNDTVTHLQGWGLGSPNWDTASSAFRPAGSGSLSPVLPSGHRLRGPLRGDLS